MSVLGGNRTWYYLVIINKSGYKRHSLKGTDCFQDEIILTDSKISVKYHSHILVLKWAKWQAKRKQNRKIFAVCDNL